MIAEAHVWPGPDPLCGIRFSAACESVKIIIFWTPSLIISSTSSRTMIVACRSANSSASKTSLLRFNRYLSPAHWVPSFRAIAAQAKPDNHKKRKIDGADFLSAEGRPCSYWSTLKTDQQGRRRQVLVVHSRGSTIARTRVQAL
jgi:hypothetical protein